MATRTQGQTVNSRGHSTPPLPHLPLPFLRLLHLFFFLALTTAPGQAAIDIPPNYQILDFKKPPEITAQPESITAFSSDIVLTCEASGNPAPEFRWEKDGKEFDVSSDPNLKMTPGSGTFQLTAEDQPISPYSGNYTCFASNALGTAVSNKVQITTENPPTLKKEKRLRLTVDEGDSKVLPCNPPASTIPPNIHWMDDKLNHIQLDGRVAQGLDGNLYFAHTKVEDSRNDYTCNMRYMSARTMFAKEPITLVVNPSNSVVRNRRPQMMRPSGSQSSYHILRGQTLTLECIVQGLPTPTIQWVRKDGEMSESRITRRNNGTLLEMTNVQEGDAGQYQCKASNSQGSAQHVYSVTVEAAPYWRKEPSSQLYAPGETVRLSCEADGVPKPQVAWSMNGNPLSEIDFDPRRSVRGSLLTLKEVKNSDTAVFQCNATNKHGSIVTNTYVYVIELPPQILTPNGKTYSFIEGQKAKLECKSFGSPRPEVTWESEEGGPLLRSSRVSQLSSGALQISSISHSDSGVYTCSIPKANMSISADLQVFNKTVIISPPLELRVQLGKSAIFTCIAKVDPSLDFQLLWRRDGQKLIDSSLDDKYTFEDPDLIVSDVQAEDEGVYTCEIITDLDMAEASGSIVIVDFPDPPTRLQITNSKLRSLTLSWTPGDDHNSPIIEYLIESEVTGVATDNWQEVTRVAADTLQSNIPLRPFLSYRLRVIAINDVGMSKPSQATEAFHNVAAVPDSNPVGVRSDSVEPDTLVITWETMDWQSFNGPNFRYKVMWRRVVGAGPAWHSNFTTTPPFVVTRVGNFTAFDIKVQAINDVGPATDPVPTIGYSGEDVPLEAPIDVAVEEINSTTIKVTWAPIRKDTVRGHLLGYKIHLWNHGPRGRHRRHGVRDLPHRQVLEVGPNEHKRLVTELQPYSRYILSLSVFNSKGEGPASEPTNFQMPEGVPSAPVSLELDSPSETEVTLRWSPPAQINGILTGYLVQYQQIVGYSAVEDGPMQYQSIDDPKATHVTLTQLDPHSRYRFQLMGRTGAGDGESISLEGATLLDGAPPTTINVSVGETSVNLSWAPQERHRNVNFHVHYINKNAQGWGKPMRKERLETSQNFHQLQGLQPGSEYSLTFIYNNTPFYSTEVRTNGSDVMHVQSGFATEGWFIGLVSAVALLVLLLLILCFIRRGKGGKYSVKDKEECHIDSEARPMKDETFGEYSDNDEKRTASQPSLCDDSKLCSDDGNLDDYGNSHSVQTEVIMDESLASQYSGGVREGPENEAPDTSPLQPPPYSPPVANLGPPVASTFIG